MDRRISTFSLVSSTPATMAWRCSAIFLVVWGTADDIADYQTQSIPLVTVLKRAGNYTRTVPIEGTLHFWISEPLDEPHSYTSFLAPELLRFLLDRL
jgi:hypothetical protein